MVFLKDPLLVAIGMVVGGPLRGGMDDYKWKLNKSQLMVETIDSGISILIICSQMFIHKIAKTVGSGLLLHVMV